MPTELPTPQQPRQSAGIEFISNDRGEGVVKLRKAAVKALGGGRLLILAADPETTADIKTAEVSIAMGSATGLGAGISRRGRGLVGASPA
jgi:hypothetical protein